MSILSLPIVGRIDKLHAEDLRCRLLSIDDDAEEVITYISSPGGEANPMSELVHLIDTCPLKTTAYAGKFVYSAAAIIYSSFKIRKAFNDSRFIIHSVKPKPGIPRTEDFDQFDLEVWKFMAERFKKISFDDLIKFGRKGNVFSVQEAFDIGMVDEIIDKPATVKNWKSIINYDGSDFMKEAHMVHFNNQQDNNHKMGRYIYPNILKLACAYGWQPMGTQKPLNYPGDWDGKYLKPLNQKVAEEDAKNLLLALKKAQREIPDKEEGIPEGMVTFKILEDNRLPADEVYEEITSTTPGEKGRLLKYFSNNHIKINLDLFIEYCEEGPFTIREC